MFRKWWRKFRLMIGVGARTDTNNYFLIKKRRANRPIIAIFAF